MASPIFEGGIQLGPQLDPRPFIEGQRLQEERRANNMNHSIQLQKLAEENAQQKIAQDAAKLKMQNEQEKLIAPQYDIDKFKTNSEYANEVINNKLSKAHQTLSSNIIAGKYANDSELNLDSASSVQDAVKYAGAVKQAATAVDQRIEELQKTNPGVDWKGYGRVVMSKLLHEKDENGKPKLIEDASKLGDIDKIMSDTLKDNTAAFVEPGDIAINSQLKKLQENKVAIDHEDEDPKFSIKGNIHPYEEPLKNADGKIIAPGIKSVVSPLVPKALNEEQKMVTPEVMQMFSNYGSAANIKTNVDDYIKKQGLDPNFYPVDSPQYDVLARGVLYNKIKSLAPNQFQTPGKSSLTAAQRNMDSGLTGQLIQMHNQDYKDKKAFAEQYKKDQADAKKEKQDEEFNKNPVAVGIRALNHDNALLSTLPKTTIAGKEHYDLSSTLGNLKIGGQDDDKKDRVVQGVFIDPNGEGMLVKFNKGTDATPFIGHPVAKKNGEDGKEGYLAHMDKAAANKFLAAIAPLNGLSPEDVPKLGAAYNKPAAQTTAPASTSGYSNVTETNKGTIGVKNGKWYDIKTGKQL